MLLFNVTNNRAKSEGHISHPANGSVRIEFKFKNALPDAITCLFYMEYDNCIRIDWLRTLAVDIS
jgi:hypothetical protein